LIGAFAVNRANASSIDSIGILFEHSFDFFDLVFFIIYD